MCENCGCHGSTPETGHVHPHEHGHSHDHPHGEGHGHTHDHDHTHVHPHEHGDGHVHTHPDGEGGDGHTHEHTHSHDHGHDHDGGHGHGHHHHHGYVPHRDGLTLVAHEGALVAAFEGETNEDKGALSARLERLTAAITDRGGRVGNIKGTLTQSGTTLFSTDGGPVSLSDGGAGGRVQLVAIVFSLTEEQLTETMQRYGFS